MLPRTFVAMLALSLIGCGSGAATAPDSSSKALKSPADKLTPADLDRLLAVVQSHGGGVIPEFSPADDVEGLDYKSSARELVSQIRTQFRVLFDPKRQGNLWSEEEEWSQAFSAHDISGPDFAALVQSVSCAVMRVRLKARVDVDRLVKNAREEVKDLVSTMDAIDEVPEAERSRQDSFIRAQSALRLARAVALLEFSQMVKRVPEENCVLVRRYSRQLKPLLPAGGSDGLLSELEALGQPQESSVIPAGHSE